MIKLRYPMLFVAVGCGALLGQSYSGSVSVASCEL